MSRARLPRVLRRGWVALLPVALAVFVAGFTLTAANTVPDTDRVDAQAAHSANDKKPDECNGITLTAVLQAPNLTGTAANELIVGSAADENLSGGGGDDCLVAGGGNDTLQGGFGTNVLIGGPGADTCLGGTGHGCEL